MHYIDDLPTDPYLLPDFKKSELASLIQLNQCRIYRDLNFLEKSLEFAKEFPFEKGVTLRHMRQYRLAIQNFQIARDMGQMVEAER